MKRSKTDGRLRLNVLFETISDDDFEIVRRSLNRRQFRSEQVILDDGTEGEELYLVVEGRVKIVKQTKTGEEKLLALLHEGDFFGELELIDGRPRSARVVSVGECLIYTLHKREFQKFLHSNHPFALRVMQVLSLRLRASNNHFISELERSALQSRLELQKLQQLIEATKTVNSTLNLHALLKLILDIALKIVNGDRGTLYLADDAKNELWSKVLIGSEHVTIRLPFGKGIAGYVAATGDTINLEDVYLDPRFNPKIDKKTGYRTRSVLCMPLKNKADKIIGVLQLLNKRKGVFTKDDEGLISALSIHAAIAIENARLYEAEKEFHQMREEVRLASKIQTELLPKNNPEIEGYDIAGNSIPAKEVGGDYYDFIPIDKDHIAFCLGDVSGKGLPASLLMANLQATLRAHSIVDGSPGECLGKSNSMLYRSTASDKFVTLFYGIIDLKKNTIVYANAGHDNPLYLSGKDKVQRLKSGGVVLGIMDGVVYEEKSIKIAGDDLIVVYSDGIVEAFNSRNEMFGEENLIDLIRVSRNLASSEIINLVNEKVSKHIGKNPQSDDMTMVVIKRVKTLVPKRY